MAVCLVMQGCLQVATGASRVATRGLILAVNKHSIFERVTWAPWAVRRGNSLDALSESSVPG